jgi:hypothetical protein
MTINGQTSVRIPHKDRRFFVDFVIEPQDSDLIRRENHERMPFPQQIEVRFQLFPFVNKAENSDIAVLCC